MIKVLINAYACSPNMGSEPGMAWNWCIHLAKYCELHIITEGEFKEAIDNELPKLEQGVNMNFYYNPVSEEIRKMCWNQGDWRFYKHYKEWQYKTYKIATSIVENNNINILHQLNMIGFREPGYLWQIANKPFVWGPIDAKEKFPEAFLQGAPIKTKVFIKLKNLITILQLKYAKRVKLAVEKATTIVAASSNSQSTLKKYFNVDSILLNETGCYVKKHEVIDKTDKENLDILWVGKLDFRKQLELAIRSVAKANNKNLILHIVGSGNANQYKELAKSLNVDKQCIWHGVITHREVQTIMQKSDIFLFTSVAEGTPHVVLEAISNNLPVICFNTCGQGDSVNNLVGLKIDLTNPKQSISDFAEKLLYAYNNKNKIKELSKNCHKRQQELSWDNKAKQMLAIYEKNLNIS